MKYSWRRQWCLVSGPALLCVTLVRACALPSCSPEAAHPLGAIGIRLWRGPRSRLRHAVVEA